MKMTPGDAESSFRTITEYALLERLLGAPRVGFTGEEAILLLHDLRMKRYDQLGPSSGKDWVNLVHELAILDFIKMWRKRTLNFDFDPEPVGEVYQSYRIRRAEIAKWFFGPKSVVQIKRYDPQNKITTELFI